MKRNKPNPKRERKRRRRANSHATQREVIETMGGKSEYGIGTQERVKVVSPVEQERRRRREARSEIPPELHKAADEMGVVLPGEEA